MNAQDNYIAKRTNDILRQRIALGLTMGGATRKKRVVKKKRVARRCPAGSRKKCIKGGAVKRKRCANGSRRVGSVCRKNTTKTATKRCAKLPRCQDGTRRDYSCRYPDDALGFTQKEANALYREMEENMKKVKKEANKKVPKKEVVEKAKKKINILKNRLEDINLDGKPEDELSSDVEFDSTTSEEVLSPKDVIAENKKLMQDLDALGDTTKSGTGYICPACNGYGANIYGGCDCCGGSGVMSGGYARCPTGSRRKPRRNAKTGRMRRVCVKNTRKSGSKTTKRKTKGNAWIKYVKKYYKEHPRLTYAEAMQKAGPSYRKLYG